MDWMYFDGKNKGTKPVILKKRQNQPNPETFVASGKQEKCVKRSRGKYNT